MRIVISIIIPIYNAEKYLNDCLNSIKAQTYLDFEVLMVNDGSSDGSKKICEMYEREDSRFHTLNQPNRGASVARNNGLTHAGGEYIAFLDSDDMIPDYFFEDSLNCLLNYNADIVFGGYHRTNNGQDYIPDIPSPKLYELEDITDLKRFFVAFCARNNTNVEIRNCPNLLSPWGKLFKSSILKNVRFQEQLVLDEDTLFNLYALDAATRVGLVPKVYYIYRVGDESLSSNVYRPNIIREFSASLDAFNEYVSLHQEENFEEELLIRIVQTYLRTLNYYYFRREFNTGNKIKLLRKFMRLEPYCNALRNAPISEFSLTKRKKIYCMLGKNRLSLLTYLFYKVCLVKDGKRKI